MGSRARCDDRAPAKLRERLATLANVWHPACAVSHDGQSKSAAPTEGRNEAAWTVGELLAWTTQRFKDLGIIEARTDAEHLLAHALSCRRLDLYLQHSRLLDAAARAGFREMVKRRLTREPVAYIEGKRGFHGLALDLQVDRRVLIPRPDTEHLVDWLLEELPAVNSVTPLHVLDIGTGSGAIALAIKHARPDVAVSASDRSPGALALATGNAQRLALSVRFIESNLLDDVPPPVGGWAAVAANLPYIPSGDLAGLAPEVRDHEPHLALDGGADGLRWIARLIEKYPWDALLRPGGFLLLEFGIDQAPAIATLLRDRGWIDVQIRRDYAGIERVILARRQPMHSDELRTIDVHQAARKTEYAPSEATVDATSLAIDPAIEWVVVPDPDPRGMADDDEG